MQRATAARRGFAGDGSAGPAGHHGGDDGGYAASHPSGRPSPTAGLVGGRFAGGQLCDAGDGG